MQSLSASDRALGDILVARRVLTLGQLDEAIALAEAWHVSLGNAILSRNWAEPAVYYQAVAYHYELPFVDLISDPPDPELLIEGEADIYARMLMMPWKQRDGRIIVATADPGPETLLFARKRWGANVAFVVVTKFDIVWAVQAVFDDALSERAVYELADLSPELSAQRVFTPGQVIFGYALLSMILLGLAASPVTTLIALNAAMSVFYLGNFVFKGLLVLFGGVRTTDETIAIEARALTDDELPVFTVLVPMYKEPAMLPMLAQALRDLDYPLGKLDIKLVLEACDHETIEVASKLGLEGMFEIIRVPPSLPQTKPKACNFALQFARGEFLVIYDAEDRPEPDQLRKVVATFRKSSADTVCLQCSLSYFNASENWLTRMFTLDYGLWFDQMLPGLDRLRIPIPLGGTSNHFKIDVLRELHGWDPFNVTEDADLGVRLTQQGYRVGIVDSTTFEEASCHAGNWIRQRSRWMKGYMQTLLVHTRRPLRFMGKIGPLGFLGFVFFIGGTVLSGLLNPVFWLLYIAWMIAAISGLEAIFPEPLLFLSLFNLLAGNGALMFLNMLAPIRRGWLNLIPYSLTAFGYWVMLSIATYRGLWQLLRNPFYWEKTHHGVSKHVARELARAQEAVA
ncbi:cellulose synthase/poly-beta-1,6-N-acetylglucosamine synthase-like glycosyltransferase [Bradyrhizobium sp. USDA 4369]